MTNQLTETQITWAKQHDWFKFVDADCGCVVVEDCYTQNGKLFVNPIIWNGTFSELRRWAGY